MCFYFLSYNVDEIRYKLQFYGRLHFFVLIWFETILWNIQIVYKYRSHFSYIILTDNNFREIHIYWIFFLIRDSITFQTNIFDYRKWIRRELLLWFYTTSLPISFLLILYWHKITMCKIKRAPIIFNCYMPYSMHSIERHW